MKLVIVVDGGLVQEVLIDGNSTDIDIAVMDHDVEGADLDQISGFRLPAEKKDPVDHVDACVFRPCISFYPKRTRKVFAVLREKEREEKRNA